MVVVFCEQMVLFAGVVRRVCVVGCVGHLRYFYKMEILERVSSLSFLRFLNLSLVLVSSSCSCLCSYFCFGFGFSILCQPHSTAEVARINRCCCKSVMPEALM